LDGKFRIHTAFSREPGQKKIYVQELIRQQSEFVSDAILNKKGYVYICGDAKHSESFRCSSFFFCSFDLFFFAFILVAREVEKELEVMLGNAKGGSEVEGAKELKALKDRNRMLMDVWS
jgi:NADPH-ferrihemoprotein reductase